MSFTELNSVEYFIIQQLTGTNLNKGIVQEATADYDKPQWRYVPAQQLQREITEILVESEVKKALIRLNPTIAEMPSRADEVLHRIRAILVTVEQVGLVRANEEFARWLKGEVTMPFGVNGQHVDINLVDFEDLRRNSYWVTNQFHVRVRETKIPDFVLLLNGIPVVIGEAKTPVRPAVTWLDGAHEIHNVYEDAVQALFVPNIFSFATEGREFFYGAVRTSLEFWSPWRLEFEKNGVSAFCRSTGCR